MIVVMITHLIDNASITVCLDSHGKPVICQFERFPVTQYNFLKLYYRSIQVLLYKHVGHLHSNSMTV